MVDHAPILPGGFGSLPGAMIEEAVVYPPRQGHAHGTFKTDFCASLAHLRQNVIILISTGDVVQSQAAHAGRFRDIQRFFETSMWMAPISHVLAFLDVEKRALMHQHSRSLICLRIHGRS